MSCQNKILCKDILKPCELNILLIPTCLKGKNRKQICKFLESCSKQSYLLMQKFTDFYHRMNLAKSYTADRKCYCPTKVTWSVCKPPLIISQIALCNYFDFYACTDTGFSFILRKTLETINRNIVHRNMIQDGKESCCGKGVCKCKRVKKTCKCQKIPKTKCVLKKKRYIKKYYK